MNYWLMKSEPEVYSIADLQQQGETIWDGVRNYQARNYLRQMLRGDARFFLSLEHQSYWYCWVNACSKNRYC